MTEDVRKKLYLIAQEAMAKAYAPYSALKVGAAVITKTGEIYTGVNVENSAFGVSLCAERNAISTAITDGHTDLVAIAVVSSKGEAYPCGTCRQFIHEFGEDIRVITGDDIDHLKSYAISELLPKGFKLNV